jgi:hypothetical protein
MKEQEEEEEEVKKKKKKKKKTILSECDKTNFPLLNRYFSLYI